MMEYWNVWNPKEYNHWYNYIWLMPIITIIIAYVWIENKIYRPFRRK